MLFSVSPEASEYGISLKHKWKLFLHIFEVTSMFHTEKCTSSRLWVTWCIDCYFKCVLHRKDCTSNSWYVSWERYSWSVPEGRFGIHGSVENWGWASEGIPLINFKGFILDDWRTHFVHWLSVAEWSLEQGCVRYV